MSPEHLEPDEGEPTLGFRPNTLHDVKPHELAIRFLFGAAISVVASIIGQVFRPVVGGMFLAFPAILPATLTLLEQKHGTRAAVHDVRGSVLGSAGLVAFAVVATALLTKSPAVLALAAATTAWIIVAVALYLVVVVWRHTHEPPRRRHHTSVPG